MTGLVLLHGWGYGPWAWAAWAEAFPQRPVAVLDAGYFGPPSLTVPDNPDGWVGVGHSQGFAHLLEMNVPWRGLVGFGAFLRFCRGPGHETGTPPELLDAMLARLDADPVDVLRRFTRRCGQEASCHAPLEDAGLKRLHADLRYLQALDLAPRPPVPLTLLAHAADDRIVPLDLAREAKERLPGAWLEVFDKGGHVLPFSRPADCLRLVREFLRELE